MKGTYYVYAKLNSVFFMMPPDEILCVKPDNSHKNDMTRQWKPKIDTFI